MKKLEEVEDKADMIEHCKDQKELKDIDEESENPKIGCSSSSRGGSLERCVPSSVSKKTDYGLTGAGLTTNVCRPRRSSEGPLTVRNIMTDHDPSCYEFSPNITHHRAVWWCHLVQVRLPYTGQRVCWVD